MEHDLLELGASRRAGGRARRRRCEVTASSERPERSPAKMMCTTCFAANARCGEIESTSATGPSTGISSSMPTSSRSSRCSASTRLSPELTPPPGSSQYSPRPAFSWRQSRMRSCQRSSAETRMRGSSAPSHRRRAEAAHAALALGQLVDLDRIDAGDLAARRAARCACRARRRTRSRSSVFSRMTFSSPR